MTIELKVSLGARSYPLFIGQNLLGELDLFKPYISGRQVMIITNDVVAPLYLKQLEHTLSAYELHSLVLPDGEKYKTLESATLVYTRLLETRCTRKVTLIALGGGVVGDITGFVAATYQRGVPFIQVPTTLLAQVDSSVGGKTGVNHPLGKNMIGAFYQPRCVVADTATLATLENRQLYSGIAEVIKYGLIRDSEFAYWLDQHLPRLLARAPDALAYAIQRSCENKADVVAKDELEEGQRALLNLGHTFGHAIETATHYTTWLHGEAVAVGMYMAAALSAALGWIKTSDLAFIEQLLIKARLPTRPPEGLSRARFLELMAVDKKVLDRRLRLVLLKSIGQAVVTDNFATDALTNLLDQIERHPTDQLLART
mgnify:CR=1 FL=1